MHEYFDDSSETRAFLACSCRKYNLVPNSSPHILKQCHQDINCTILSTPSPSTGSQCPALTLTTRNWLIKGDAFMWVNSTFAEEIQLSRSRRDMKKQESRAVLRQLYFFLKSHSVCQGSGARSGLGARERSPAPFPRNENRYANPRRCRSP